MIDWPDEFHRDDPFFAIIVNRWMEWEDLDVLLETTNKWAKHNLSRRDRTLIDFIIGVS